MAFEGVEELEEVIEPLEAEFFAEEEALLCGMQVYEVGNVSDL